ncbi:MAG: tetratricopeptide repeat protein [Bacteroidetes bacterium]|jgi:tetratricopeptide (TPR) repeat protein|nr:tetratricopeptide repeat protein [Bacteroidota bacterium]
MLHILSGLFFTLVFFSCGPADSLPELRGDAQAISLLGDTLRTPTLDTETEQEYRENLDEAMKNYRIDPEEPENVIWLGRRMAYLGNYREAVEIFTEGVFKHSEDPRMYRHRGHRYLTLRMFDRAIADFESAADLMKNMTDRVEPDGLPNEQDQPTSTLKSNVWYHLGLAHYVQGNYPAAIDSYENALELDLTPDMRIATLYWYYMALRRNGNDERAGEMIADISPDLEVIENDAYLNLLLVFNGVFRPEQLTESPGDELHSATLGYGIGNWHYINGREERAYDIWQEIYNEGNWPAFGFIAAEAELAELSE